jgi:flagellum-specific peptidoglycan hydrolase FlgJ
MASRLAEIYRSEKKIGGGLGSAVGKRLTEKIDPRKMLDQSGLLVSMFPSLKAYNPTKNVTATGNQASIDKKEEAQTDVLREILQVSSLVSRNSSINAKNSLVLPAMARDMNLMRQNMAKLVKLQGGVASNKADMFFKRAGERESMYESSLSKLFKKDKTGSVSKIGASTTGGGLGLDPSQIIASMAAGSMMRSVASMVSSLLMNPIVLGVLGGSLLIYLAKRFAEEDLKKPENKDAPINKVRRGEAKTLGEAGEKNRQKALGKLTTQGTANEIVKRLIEDKLTGSAAESFVKDIARESNLQEVLDICDPKLKEDYLKMVASLQPPAPQQPPPSTPPPPLPATGAGGGRGFVNPELVSPSPSPVPSNVIMSGSGVPLTSGSGEYITSGQGTSPVESTTGTQDGTMGAYKARRQTSMSSSGSAGGGRGFMSPTSPTTVTENTSSNTGPNGEFKSKDDFLKVMYPLAVEASKQLGGVDPNALLTQWGFESAWGTKTSGKYNYFGIKADKSWTGDKKDVMTHEYLQGEKVTLPQPFRSYNSPKEAVEDYINFLKKNKRYEKAGVFQAKTSSEYFGALQKAGYATDPNYANKLTSATEGTARKTAQLQMPSPSTGVQVASASTSVADGQRQSMAQPTGGTAVVGSQPPRQTLASTQRKPGSAYDTDLINTLIGRQSATA